MFKMTFNTFKRPEPSDMLYGGLVCGQWRYHANNGIAIILVGSVSVKASFPEKLTYRKLNEMMNLFNQNEDTFWDKVRASFVIPSAI